MTVTRSLASFIATIALALITHAAWAQGRGDYFNVESPQVHPIDVATIGGDDYLLIVNTPDNSLEIWQTDEAVPIANRFVLRVPVGLEPVSVRWHAGLGTAYVANFLGDSITAISLTPHQSQLLTARLLTQAPVTDAPLDMTFATVEINGEPRDMLVATHMTLDAISKLDALTLAPLEAGSERLDAVVSAGVDLDFDSKHTVDDIALKEPRTAAVACERLFVIGHKGGNTERYDFDLYTESLRTGDATALGGLGSQNTNLALAPNDQLLVVGAMARNELRDEDQVAAAESGFVKSMFYLVENPCGEAPIVHARDVNMFSLVDGIDTLPLGTPQRPGDPFPNPVPIFQPVPKSEALAYLTDVIAYAPNGTLEKVFFTAFSSDRVGVIEPSTDQAPIFWPLRRVDIDPLAAAIAGPRGLALRGGATPRLYVLNRIDNSVTIIDVDSELVLESFALAADPTPTYITEGRRYLYDAKLSGNGFVSCASCHHDGRTDGLAWDLGDGNAATIPPPIRQPVGEDQVQITTFDADKEFMVTQSLEGLLNYEVNPNIQHLFTNAPYHWRGDREDFLAFNGAFVSLLGGDLLPPDDMEAFEEFINSVQYAPNPKQARDRVPPGLLGDPDDNDTSVDVDGEGAMLGLKLYHTAGLVDGSTCVGCHALPEGSDNVLTENIAAVNPHPVLPPPFTNPDDKFMETSALRMLFQKEARLDRDGSSTFEQSPITGYEGLMHTGLAIAEVSDNYNGVPSLNGFNTNFFSGTLCGEDIQYCKNMRAVMEFVHQFDTGAGPMIGHTIAVDSDNKADTDVLDDIEALERQAALANAGISGQLWIDGGVRGLWYDVSASPPVYREEPSGLTIDRDTLLSVLNNARDRLVLMGVPLGSERRVASPTGQTLPLFGPPPANITLLPMVTNSWYAQVPQLSAVGALNFISTHFSSMFIYQAALTMEDTVNGTPAPGFGLCQLRHEAPRRFRVSGEHLRHGSQLHLFVHDDAFAGPPNVNLGPDDPGQVQVLPIVLPLHPTVARDDAGNVIWETAAELEALLFYRLMVGRPDQVASAQGVMVNLTDIDYEKSIVGSEIPALFDPESWNHHYVRVVNADGSSADGGWQAVEIEPGPLCP